MPPGRQPPVRPAAAVPGIVVAGLAVRAALAAAFPLTTDEAYYVDWARHLSPGYLDHPPLVAWLIAGPLAAFGQHALAVRAPALLLQAGTTLLAASLSRALAPPGGGDRAALAAAVLLQAAPMFSVGALLMTPDAPLAFAWAGALWSFHRALPGGGRPRGGAFVLAGLFLGLAALAKLHAALLAAALAAALVATRDGRRALATPWPWAALAVALLVASPMLAWNAARGWPTFLFQARHGLSGRSFSTARLLASVAGQAAYVSPLLLALAVAAGARALRRGPAVGAARLAVALAALPVAAFFTLSAAFTPGALPHWAAPAWLAALLLLASDARAEGARALRRGAAVGLAMTAALLVAVPLAPRVVGSALDELRGWREAVEAGRAAAPDARLAATHWMALGHLGWYAREPLAYVSDRPCAATYYAPARDPRPLLLVVAEGLGPSRQVLERLAGPLEERGEATARAGDRIVRRYRFYAAAPRREGLP